VGEVLSFATPLLLLPGAALMLVSTSPRYESLHAEIHHLMAEGPAGAMCVEHVLRRARLLRSAMVLLYCACAFFSASGLIGGATTWLAGTAHPLAWGLGGAGVACVVLASIELVRESIVSLRVVEDHGKDILGD
jgi:hypothetical protein